MKSQTPAIREGHVVAHTGLETGKLARMNKSRGRRCRCRHAWRCVNHTSLTSLALDPVFMWKLRSRLTAITCERYIFSPVSLHNVMTERFGGVSIRKYPSQSGIIARLRMQSSASSFPSNSQLEADLTLILRLAESGAQFPQVVLLYTNIQATDGQDGRPAATSRREHYQRCVSTSVPLTYGRVRWMLR